jgi:hypothetical protein
MSYVVYLNTALVNINGKYETDTNHDLYVPTCEIDIDPKRRRCDGRRRPYSRRGYYAYTWRIE